MALTRPKAAPQSTTSPTRSVPFCTNSLATTPRPSCSSASRQVPTAGRSGLALYSCSSATVSSVSSSSSMPAPVMALVLHHFHVAAPFGWAATRWRPTAGRSAVRSTPGRSILFRATTIGTPAARAWLMASSVCGITPSSAATTSTAMSVTLAPRARISVKASWPGVSTKAIGRPSFSIAVGADVLRDAAASRRLATSMPMMRSNSDVLPWSTWPRKVTTGGRGCQRGGSSSLFSDGRAACSSRADARRKSTSTPISTASSSAVSGSVGVDRGHRAHAQQLAHDLRAGTPMASEKLADRAGQFELTLSFGGAAVLVPVRLMCCGRRTGRGPAFFLLAGLRREPA